MADETLRIRVDVNTATLREMSGALKEIRSEMQTAAQGEVKNLNSEYQAISGRIRELTGRHGEFTQSVRHARTEARTFRFALLELTHGLDGVVNTFGTFTGAGHESKETLKAITGSAKEALGAGLGLKFGFEAIGGSLAGMATGVGIAVGALTLLAGIIEHNREAAEAQRLEMDKQIDRTLELEKALGQLTRAQYLNALQADILLAKSKVREAETGHFTKLGAGVGGLALVEDKAARELAVKTANANVLEAEKKFHEAISSFRKEDIESQKKVTEASTEATKISIKAIEDRIASEERLKSVLDPSYDMSKKFLQVYIDINQALATGNASLLERTAHLSLVAEVEQSRLQMLGAAKGVNVSAAQGAEFGSFDEIMGGWMMGIEVLTSGFRALSSTIHEGLINAFGQASSIFQQFVVGVLDGIASIAERLASSAIIAGIFSLFGFGFGGIFSALAGFKFDQGGIITEPVFGVGISSGKPYSFAETAPERVSPLTSFGSPGGGSGVIEVVGELRGDGRHLVATVKQGRVYDRMSGGNF